MSVKMVKKLTYQKKVTLDLVIIIVNVSDRSIYMRIETLSGPIHV